MSWILAALVAVAALAPWWRNHTQLRSFFDYGLVIGGVGRIEAGQRPYVDFISPAQAGWFGLNWLSEKAAGGTYQGMTAGGAASIVISLIVLTAILARRWPLSSAALMAGALTCATVSQHTLWWYNPWGVVLLVVVAWAAAVAPVLRRKDAGWHALVAAALFFGGINKINMQLMAAGLAVAWAVRAGLTGASSWRRVGLTGVFYAGCLVLPVLAEMAWTGASFAAWWHNVIAMPAASRSSMALAAFAPKYLFTPFNNHYADVVLLQGGLVGAVLTLLTLAAILRKTWGEAGPWGKFLPVVCAAVAYLGGIVLLSTNMDIVYIGVGGWIGLLVALWLGFELPARGPWFYGALVAPAVLVGAIAWHSAWIGQRSQFGHSGSPWETYVDAAEAGPDFAYFRGTKMPPETVASLRAFGEWRRSLPADRQATHFFGAGTEWAAHLWPAMKTPGLPLSIYRQPGNSDVPEVVTRLSAALRKGELREITVARVVDFWEKVHEPLLIHRYDKQPVGETFARYSAHAMLGVSGSPVWFTRAFGGNADSRRLTSDAWFVQREEWHQFLGVTEGRGTMHLQTPSNRLQGEIVVRRLPGAPASAASADFAIYAQADATALYERWKQRVELPAGQEEVRVTYAIDGSGLPTSFTVDIPVEDVGKIAAGWRGPQIQHTRDEGPEQPDWLFLGRGESTVLDEAALGKLLPAGWRPEKAFMRKGQVTEQGIELFAGGEIWLKARDFVTEFSGRAEVIRDWDPTYIPFVRGMWYRGGRLEVYTQMLVREGDRATDFNAWCSEPGGWLIIAVDPLLKDSSVRVRVHKVTQR